MNKADDNANLGDEMHSESYEHPQNCPFGQIEVTVHNEQYEIHRRWEDVQNNVEEEEEGVERHIGSDGLVERLHLAPLAKTHSSRRNAKQERVLEGER